MLRIGMLNYHSRHSWFSTTCRASHTWSTFTWRWLTNVSWFISGQFFSGNRLGSTFRLWCSNVDPVQEIRMWLFPQVVHSIHWHYLAEFLQQSLIFSLNFLCSFTFFLDFLQFDQYMRLSWRTSKIDGRLSTLNLWIRIKMYFHLVSIRISYYFTSSF